MGFACPSCCVRSSSSTVERAWLLIRRASIREQNGVIHFDHFMRNADPSPISSLPLFADKDARAPDGGDLGTSGDDPPTPAPAGTRGVLGTTTTTTTEIACAPRCGLGPSATVHLSPLSRSRPRRYLCEFENSITLSLHAPAALYVRAGLRARLSLAFLSPLHGSLGQICMCVRSSLSYLAHRCRSRAYHVNGLVGCQREGREA